MIINADSYFNVCLEVTVPQPLEEAYFDISYKSKNNKYYALVRDRTYHGKLGHEASAKFSAKSTVNAGNSFPIMIPKRHEPDQTIRFPPNTQISDINKKCVKSAFNFCEFHRQALLDFDMFDQGSESMCPEQEQISEAIKYNCNVYIKGLNEKGETIITDIKVRDFGRDKDAVPLSDEEYYSNFKKLYRTILWKRRVTGNSI